ncbi:MAG TPA: hypothetical protein PLR06_06210 [Cyclobacteriaceae bacterium]|nr:hypothetical protein [Cyclobacteriaceae bacterium]
MSKRITSRIHRMIALFILILVCMTYSQFAGATPPKSRMSKAKYRASWQTSSHKACYLLHKKRTSLQSLSASVRRPKSRPMAETD